MRRSSGRGHEGAVAHRRLHRARRRHDRSPRVFWSNPETTKSSFARSRAAVLPRRQGGLAPTLKEHLGIDNDQEAGLVWDELRNAFGAELPPDLFREILDPVARPWSLPGNGRLISRFRTPEQFVARKLLDPLNEMGYVPTKVDSQPGEFR
jgi:hypothetical protein